ncbi:MAG TPA: DUF5714 domain-containing protein [Bacillota bacterium]|nr:DUF5714 domain-containing protein [Bacillota bacterium]
MHFSKNNMVVQLHGSEPSEYAILNPLSGAFDLMDQREYELFNTLKATGSVGAQDQDFTDYLLQRGYVYPDSQAEGEKIRVEYIKFQEEIDNSQVQLLLIPSYSCNLACVYCYEHSLPEKGKLITSKTLDAFFEYVRLNFGQGAPKGAKKKRPFITLFGGEPLIDNPSYRAILEKIVNHCVAGDYELSVVTNGYALGAYVNLLSKARIKEIQVTVDGSKAVHDKRRGTLGGAGTLDQIIIGLEAAIAHHLPINFRTVVDFENLLDLVNLARFVAEKGWLDLGPELFKTQIGRNYELFDCYAKPQHLMSQVALWAEFTKLSREYPILQKFHRPDFKGIRHLVDTGDMYMASFDTCPAAKTEWVFDLHGDIYGCTASCGREEFRLGSFYPEVKLEKNAVAEWQNRNILNIPECVDCPSNLICGGGCGVVAAQKNGKVLSPDCRPIPELIELGVNYYQAEIKQMVEPPLQVAPGLTPANTNPDYNTGCIVCGAPLIYQSQPVKAKCEICRHDYETDVACSKGHYVCDNCHRKDILSRVEEICLETTLTDPVELAQIIFALPALKMHGPEYHSIVPAIIVTAYGNTIHRKNPADIKTAIERGKAIKGGSCGSHGACGAAIGIGIAYSIIHGVSPLSGESRGEANRYTAEALLALSAYGGPRCCKREAVLTLELARQLLPDLAKEDSVSYECKQFRNNPDCIHDKCSYFPKRREIENRIERVIPA